LCASVAERVTQALWRLNRVVRYETAVIATARREVVERLRAAPDWERPPGEPGAQDLLELEQGVADQERLQANDEALRRLMEALRGMPDSTPIEAGLVNALFDEASHHLPEDIPVFEDGPLVGAVWVPADEDSWKYSGRTASTARRSLEELARWGRTTAERLLERSAAANREGIDKRLGTIERLIGQAEALRGPVWAGEARAAGPGLADGVEGHRVRRVPEPTALPGAARAGAPPSPSFGATRAPPAGRGCQRRGARGGGIDHPDCPELRLNRVRFAQPARRLGWVARLTVLGPTRRAKMCRDTGVGPYAGSLARAAAALVRLRHLHAKKAAKSVADDYDCCLKEAKPLFLRREGGIRNREGPVECRWAALQTNIRPHEDHEPVLDKLNRIRRIRPRAVLDSS
jgi:hypothetical protein